MSPGVDPQPFIDPKKDFKKLHGLTYPKSCGPAPCDITDHHKGDQSGHELKVALELTGHGTEKALVANTGTSPAGLVWVALTCYSTQL